MLYDILKESGESLFKEIGKDTIKKAASTLVSESVKAAVEIWKKRQIRRDQYDFSEWKKSREDAGESAKKAKKSEDEDDVADEEKPAEEAGDSESAPDEPERDEEDEQEPSS